MLRLQGRGDVKSLPTFKEINMIVRDFMYRVNPADRIKKSVRQSHTYRAERREAAKRDYRLAKRNKTETGA